MRIITLGLATLVGCGPPQTPTATVGYRNGLEPGEPNSGERGTVKISEVFWMGSVDNDGDWDPSDVFVELRNESNRAVNISGWRLVLEGSRNETWIIPQSELEIPVDSHIFLAAKSSGCFPEPDFVLEGLRFMYGDPFLLTLRDSDERLIEPVGSTEAPPFAGGYDGEVARSMERIQLMFGGEGTFPHSWHYYAEDEDIAVPNDDRVSVGCQERTRASPGRPNSTDYSGAFASGSFE
jgi:hypothetical protein